MLCNLFNLIFDTGIIPEVWTVGLIKPVYKNKGSPADPSNYRPITLLSCVGKLFTAIINIRLQKYADEHNIIEDCQTGFRKGFSTTDNIFALHNLIDIICKSKKSIFCAFIDLKQAFDRVWREGLWQKMLSYNINGKCLRVIQNMYYDIKSCIIANGNKSPFFLSNIGVRQGENLSPFLFNIFLNDLNNFFSSNNIQGIICQNHELDDDIVIFLKLFLLLYADDTVILSESAEDLQTALNVYENYCRMWKLSVNITKSKVLIFSKGKHQNYRFEYNKERLEIVTEYKYLGVYFAKNNSFFKTKKYIADQATKAVFSLIKKARNMHLTIDLQLELFDKLVKPILLYGCEVWGFGNIEVIERVQLKFLKNILKLKTSTPNYMVYGEVGIMPLKIDIYTRMISYWGKICRADYNANLVSTCIYNAARSYYNCCNITDRSFYFRWIHCIKSILCNCGFSGIWENNDFPNQKWLSLSIKQKLTDIYLNEWYQNVEMDKNYRLFKKSFKFENYISTVPYNMLSYIISFKTRNHKLPVEKGRWNKIEYNRRLCDLCKQDIGDEYHYLLTCNNLKDMRKQYIKPYFYRRPNILKYEQLLNSKNMKILMSLAKFIKYIYDINYENTS